MDKKARREKISIQRLLLTTIGAAGLLSLTLVAPNAIQALEKIRRFQTKMHRNRYKNYIEETLEKLQKKGFIKLKETGQGVFYELTEQGEVELLRHRLEPETPEKKKWDGKWRVVIFDIKELRRPVRDKLRKHPIDLGFFRLQNSVWISPDPCEKVVEFLKANQTRDMDILTMVVEKMEDDRSLRGHFNLL